MSIYNLGRVLPIFKGEYDNNETYTNLDVVYYNGSSYVAKGETKGNLPTDDNNWQPLAMAGVLDPEQIADIEQQIIEYVQGQGYVIDSDYTHTDNNFTDSDKTKLDGIDLSTKQDTLVSGENIKTINGNNILGNGNLEIQTGSGTTDYTELINKPSINGTTLEGNVNLATPEDLDYKQDTLISGENIKTINSESILGFGNITIQGGEAVNPFKGLFDNLTQLQTSYPSPSVGDYAYVKGATSTDPIKIYECNTAGSWVDSGRTVDISGVQTFASGESLDSVRIINNFTGGEHDVLSAQMGKKLGDSMMTIKQDDFEITMPNNGYIKWSDGSNGGSTETNKRTNNYINVSNYTNLKYKLGMIGTVAAVVAFYDSSSVYMQSASVRGNSNTQISDIDLTTITDVKYVRVCTAASLTDAYAILYNRNTLEYKVLQLDNTVSKMNETEGIKVLIFGDSITDNMGLSVNDTTNCSESCYFRSTDYVNEQGETIVYNKWPKLLADYFNTNEVRNYARSGASYKDQPAYTSGENRRRSLSYQITVAENDLTNPNNVFPTQGTYNPDVVIFALGTNDGNPNDTFESAISKIVSTTTSIDIASTLAGLNRSKFHEAVLYAFLKVKSMFPTALFLCLLPIQRWSNTAVMGGLHNGLKAMANYFSIPVIDGAYEMGVIKALEVDSGLGELLKDGLHPNEKGQNVMARMIINQIKSRFVSMNNMN